MRPLVRPAGLPEADSIQEGRGHCIWRLPHRGITYEIFTVPRQSALALSKVESTRSSSRSSARVD